jgi:hypothetical protein
MLDRINFVRGRIYPSFQVKASAGADIFKSDHVNTRFQIEDKALPTSSMIHHWRMCI